MNPEHPVASQLEERNRLLEQQISVTDELAEEVRQLREALRGRPTREEVDQARLRALIRAAVGLFVAMLVAVYLAVWFHEVYRDACELGPVVSGEAPPGWCGRIFPGQEQAGPRHAATHASSPLGRAAR